MGVSYLQYIHSTVQLLNKICLKAVEDDVEILGRSSEARNDEPSKALSTALVNEKHCSEITVHLTRVNKCMAMVITVYREDFLYSDNNRRKR